MRPLPAPLSYHLDLYRYWDAKRWGRSMPARKDLSPSEVPVLLPHLTLIDVIDGRFRYRLVGSKVVQDLGREMTGTWVGTHVTPPAYAAALCSIYEQVCSGRRPIFTTGEYRSPSKLMHAVSRLLVPLSEDGESVNMILLSRVSRYDRQGSAANWLGRTAGAVGDTTVAASAEDVITLCLDWERQCAAKEVPPYAVVATGGELVAAAN